jgi:accessory colonization factor AcfC
MCIEQTHLASRLLILMLSLVAIGGGQAFSQDALHVYGPEGPYPAMRQAALAFSKRNAIDVEVVGDPTSKWLTKAKNDGDLIFSSAEFMMIDFIRDMEGRIDEASITPLYWRPSAILVRPGNPKHILDLPDLLRPGIKVMVVNGSGQTGLWEDMAGKRGNFRTVRALRNNIVLFADNSTDARRLWLARKEIDAWLTWNIWYAADSRNSQLVPVSEDYVIYRQCSIALTQRAAQQPAATEFLRFLTTPEAANIFAEWGWITTPMDSLPLAPRGSIRVVHDVQENSWASGVGSGLARVEQLVSDYEAMGFHKSELNISVVFHGAAAYWMLDDEPYAAFIGQPERNPNRPMIRELIERGVTLEVCAETMKANGWKRRDIVPGVNVVSGVCQRVVDLERRGYVYMRP